MSKKKSKAISKRATRGLGPRVTAELEAIAAKHDGVLRPEDVVRYAENPNTALHQRFQWDNSKAGPAYRLCQAREIIELQVTIIPATGQTMRVYVSMRKDRKVKGGGYRLLVDVMSRARTRKAFLAEALANLAGWQKKYETLKELEPIFAAAREVAAKNKAV